MSRLTSPFLRSLHFCKSGTLQNQSQDQSKDYPLDLPIFQKDIDLEFTKPITFFVGDNGTGKSTLLEFIAYASGFNLQGGSKNNMYTARGIEDSRRLDILSPHMTLRWLPKISTGFFMRAETLFNFFEHIFDPSMGMPESTIQNYYGGRLLEKSHGESFMSLIKHRFQGKGIYLLDEPEAALSPTRQIELLKVLQNFETSAQQQFIIITHSPILMSYPGADIRLFDERGIYRVAKEEVKGYQLYKEFLSHPEAYI